MKKVETRISFPEIGRWHCFPSECPPDYVSQTFRYFPSTDQTPCEELPFTWLGPSWQSSAKENSSWDGLGDGDDMESAEVLVTSSPSASTCLLKLCKVPSVCCFPLINTSACLDIQRRSWAWKCLGEVYSFIYPELLCSSFLTFNIW